MILTKLTYNNWKTLSWSNLLKIQLFNQLKQVRTVWNFKNFLCFKSYLCFLGQNGSVFIMKMIWIQLTFFKSRHFTLKYIVFITYYHIINDNCLMHIKKKWFIGSSRFTCHGWSRKTPFLTGGRGPHSV
jgi:hypothetical protein